MYITIKFNTKSGMFVADLMNGLPSSNPDSISQIHNEKIEGLNYLMNSENWYDKIKKQ